MHSCLDIDEIVQNVVAYIQGRRSLSKLALVSRAFVEPANDALWSDLPGLEPLMNCLFGGGHGKPVHPDARAMMISTEDQVPEANWRRFKQHAGRVRSLVVPSEDWEPGCDVSEDELAFLAKHHPDPIIPRLQHLVWASWELARFAPLFVQSTLLTLECFFAFPDEIRPVLERVRTAAPHLQRLDIHKSPTSRGCFPKDPVFSDIMTTVSHLHYLVQWTFPEVSLPSDTLLHLSQLQRFATLHLPLAEHNAAAWRARSWGRFPTLQELVLICRCSGSSVTGFLQGLCGSRLVDLELDIQFWTFVHVDEFKQFISTIGLFQHLTALSIQFSPNVTSLGPVQPADSITLGPLYAITGITSIALKWAPVVFTPGSVAALVNAWPELEQIDIMPHWDALQCQFEIENLAILSRGCRALRSVKVQVQPVDPDWSHETEISWPISVVTSLHFYRSHISPQAEAAVSKYLAAVFPLARVHHDFSRSGPRRTPPRPEDVAAVDLFDRISASKRELAFDVFRQALAARREA